MLLGHMCGDHRPGTGGGGRPGPRPPPAVSAAVRIGSLCHGPRRCASVWRQAAV